MHTQKHQNNIHQQDNDNIQYLQDEEQEQQPKKQIKNKFEDQYEQDQFEDIQQINNHSNIKQENNNKYDSQKNKQPDNILIKNERIEHGKKTQLKYEPIKTQSQPNQKPKPNEMPSKANNYNQKSKPTEQKLDSTPIIPPQVKHPKKQADEFLDQKDNNKLEQQNEITKPQEQTIYALKNVSKGNQQSFENSHPIQSSQNLIQSQQKTSYTKQQLSKVLYQNQRTIKQLKQKINAQKNQIKNISNVIDKDIQKNITKMSKNQTINIKNYFSNEANQAGVNENDKIVKYRQELKGLRTTIKKVKDQIHEIELKMSDPITIQNINKNEQFEGKVKLLTQQVKNLTEQKELISFEITRMKQSLGLEQQQQYNLTKKKNQLLLNTALIEIKEQRAKLYQLQKSDIMLMEKLKFLIEKDQKITLKTADGGESLRSMSQSKQAKDQILNEMKVLINEIDEILEQRNKIENQQTKVLKFLQNEAERIQSQNLKMLNEVRYIDSTLLQYYSQQATRRRSNKPKTVSSKKQDQTIDHQDTPLLHQKSVQLSEFNDKNLIISKKKSTNILNDKNIDIYPIHTNNKFRSKITSTKKAKQKSVETVIQTQINKDSDEQLQLKQSSSKKQPKQPLQSKYKQIKRQYNFGDLTVDQKGAILSDQILGRVKLREITIFVDEKCIFGLQCKYYSLQKAEIIGMKICEKNAEDKCERIGLVLQQDEQIASIKMGYAKSEVRCFQVTSTAGRTLKWGDPDISTKFEQKKIGGYESLVVRAKLINTEQLNIGMIKTLNELKEDKPKLKLAGLGFIVTQRQKAI